VAGVESRPPPATADTASDLQHWSHSSARDCRRLPDSALRTVLPHAAGHVSFVFHQKSHESNVQVAEQKLSQIAITDDRQKEDEQELNDCD
jgi:hypothetical protein